MSGRLLQISAFAVNRLWSEVQANLCKDLGVGATQAVTFHRLWYLAPSEAASGIVARARVANQSDKDLLAFTCGHVYQKRYFYEEVLPVLVQRLTMSARLSVTSKLLLAEYQQTAMALSCPACLLGFLQHEVPHSVPTRRVLTPPAVKF
jgi:hypothetical protein